MFKHGTPEEIVDQHLALLKKRWMDAVANKQAWDCEHSLPTEIELTPNLAPVRDGRSVPHSVTCEDGSYKFVLEIKPWNQPDLVEKKRQEAIDLYRKLGIYQEEPCPATS